MLVVVAFLSIGLGSLCKTQKQMKHLLTILSVYACISLIMKLLHFINGGDIFLSLLSITGIYLIGFATIKTNFFTNFKFKKK
jgi:hypothetical protein